MRRPFKSGLGRQFDEYVRYLEASGSLNETYYENLHYFDNHLAENFKGASELSEEMLEWCRPRESENGNSCRVRSTVIRNFAGHANRMGWADVSVPKNRTNVPCAYVPHYFTSDELARFFKECDRYFLEYKRPNTLQAKSNRLQLPVYFRLLLSTGLRTCEARWLKRADVNFENGVVNVRKSKGRDEHRIVLGDSALKMLRRYDNAMDALMPGRAFLFPDIHDKCHKPRWGWYYFSIIWQRVSQAPAREYDMRSMYAVLNISKWENHGFELSGKLLILSRSMGHRDINSTFGYFHLTPMLADKLRRNTSPGFSELCPPMPDDED